MAGSLSACGRESPPLDPLPAAAVRAQVAGATVLPLNRLPGHATWWVRDSDASDLVDPELRIVTSDTAWTTWWHRAAGLSHRPVPAVDFRRASVLIAASGVRPAGTGILIEGAALRGDTLFVLVRHDRGIPGACQTDGTVNPAAAAIVPVSAPRAVVFRDRTHDFGCPR